MLRALGLSWYRVGDTAPEASPLPHSSGRARIATHAIDRFAYDGIDARKMIHASEFGATDEVVDLYEKFTRAGVVFSARKPSAALHAMQSSADSDTGFDESAVRALLKSKDPALHALISDAGYKRTKSKSGTAGKGKSKGKGKAKQRRSKSDDKYTRRARIAMV